MLQFFKKRKNSGNSEILRKINGKSIRYAARRDEDGEETVIGKNGRINVLEDYIVLVCDGSEVFRCLRRGASAAELMSLGGVVISGVGESGDPDQVVAYYTYHRK